MPRMNGDELKRALERIGMSQRRFAALLAEYQTETKMTPTTVNHWCTGKHPVPGAVALAVTLLERIKTLGDDFLGDK
jgi:transcriptional regulator with XRE-family HTH domain